MKGAKCDRKSDTGMQNKKPTVPTVRFLVDFAT